MCVCVCGWAGVLLQFLFAVVFVLRGVAFHAQSALRLSFVVRRVRLMCDLSLSLVSSLLMCSLCVLLYGDADVFAILSAYVCGVGGVGAYETQQSVSQLVAVQCTNLNLIPPIIFCAVTK